MLLTILIIALALGTVSVVIDNTFKRKPPGKRHSELVYTIRYFCRACIPAALGFLAMLVVTVIRGALL